MPSLKPRNVVAEDLDELKRRLSDVEEFAERLGVTPIYTADGAKALDGPLTHTGDLVGFFSKSPSKKAAAVATVTTGTPEASAINSLITVLQSYGLLP